MTPAWTILSAFAAALLVPLLPARSAGLAKMIALAGSLVGAVAAAVSCLCKLMVVIPDGPVEGRGHVYLADF